MADSLALIADAGHNLSDVISLLLAWGANHISTKHATEKRTYGLRRLTILASLSSAFGSHVIDLKITANLKKLDTVKRLTV